MTEPKVLSYCVNSTCNGKIAVKVSKEELKLIITSIGKKGNQTSILEPLVCPSCGASSSKLLFFSSRNFWNTRDGGKFIRWAYS